MFISSDYEIHTNGKLLISGEYYVLDGALALAVPAKKGQVLSVKPGAGNNTLGWRSLDLNGETWFEAKISIPDLTVIKTTDDGVGDRLERILKEAQKLIKGEFTESLNLTTRLEFPREWGLGTSSTLIASIATWLKIDPYELLWKSFGGSGYDLACALNDHPILYQVNEGRPVITQSNFNPSFKDQLYFTYLGKKQNSREGIEQYRAQGEVEYSTLDEVSKLTEAFVSAKQLDDFERAMKTHENLVSKQLGLEKAKDIHFKSYPGEIKSLGAWGGDFVLATSPMSEKETKAWFNRNGFNTVFRFDELVAGF
jgi:mevalonate kinase